MGVVEFRLSGALAGSVPWGTPRSEHPSGLGLGGLPGHYRGVIIRGKQIGCLSALVCGLFTSAVLSPADGASRPTALSDVEKPPSVPKSQPESTFVECFPMGSLSIWAETDSNGNCIADHQELRKHIIWSAHPIDAGIPDYSEIPGPAIALIPGAKDAAGRAIHELWVFGLSPKDSTPQVALHSQRGKKVLPIPLRRLCPTSAGELLPRFSRTQDSLSIRVLGEAPRIIPLRRP